jgi:hypothetical protein
LSGRPGEDGDGDAGAGAESDDDSMANLHLGERAHSNLEQTRLTVHSESTWCQLLTDFISIGPFQHGFTARKRSTMLGVNQVRALESGSRPAERSQRTLL